ncbi:Heat shock protein HslJ [Flavobacteriaceae bacterium MAR_2010_188]|nr:Heat shock protein HslJ [Flavobacteriaceae bacterium MAR_2010_188]
MKNLFRIPFVFLLVLSCKSKVSETEQIKVEDEAGNSKIDSTVKESRTYFFATGTEPFWSLDISEDLIKFKTPSDSIFFPYADPILAQDHIVKRYDLETESSKMNIQIVQVECINEMSGIVSNYRVSISYKEGNASEFKNLEGCGDYKTDYRLHDFWVLESLNGKAISKEDFSNEFPTMEINSTENTFLGFAGCNRINGKLFFEKVSIRFTNIVTTKMMCEPTNKEAQFLKALEGITQYSIENNRLTLSNPSGILTVFKKVD